MRRHLAAAHALPLALAVVVATTTFLIRALRWRLLLRGAADAPLPLLPLWHATALGFMANNLLPFRAGELIRPLAVAKLAGVRFTAALSSVAVERIFDGLTVTLFLTLALLSPGLAPGVAVGGVPVSRIALVAGALSTAGLIAAAFVVTRPLVAERMVRAVIPRVGLADKIVGIIEGIRHGLAVLDSPARVGGVILWSLVHWLVNGVSFYIAFQAFDIPVSFTGAILMQGLLAFGVSVPSTPGFIGPFEAAIVAALALYGVPSDRSFSYAIGYHVTTFLPITLLGLWSLSRTPFGLRDLRRPPATT